MRIPPVLRQNAALILLLLTLLFVLSMGCASSNQSTVETPTDMTVNEKAGPLFDEEKELFSALEDHGILIPDSIVVVKDSLTHGFVKRMAAPNTIHLTTVRAEYPDAEIPRDFPYLYGRTHKPKQGVFRKYVAAHELAHIHGPRLKAELGRPALGLDTRTDEIQSDILALVLLDLVYGLSYEDLGYPAKVDYPHLPDKTVPTLQRKYCIIVQKTWDVEAMNCFT